MHENYMSILKHKGCPTRFDNTSNQLQCALNMNYNCNSCYVVNIINCQRCDSRKNRGQASTNIRLCMNKKKSIRDNSKGDLGARYFKKHYQFISDLEWVILNDNFPVSTDRLMQEQTFIFKLIAVTHHLSHDFLGSLASWLSYH